MKKNISINISGIIFHIEEDGYETLKRYLDSINKYFSTFEDSSEILADIESRIAEIFLSRLNEEKQVITQDDVQSLMATMGSVNDFRAAEEPEEVKAETNNTNTASGEQQQSSNAGASSNAGRQTYTPPKQFMRDQKRKLVGGVCTGLANYFNIDSLWVRLLFVALFIPYGLSFIAYMILWIVIPGSYDLDEPVVEKKMFRDSERKVLGGVSGGVAAYLNIDIIAVRILFILLTIPGGLGFLIYIVLWIILPEARTLTEKIQMQGEAVTLSSIESNIKKNQTDQTTAKEETTFTKILLFPFRVIGMILTGLGKILLPIVEIIRVAIGVLVIMVGLGFLFGAVIAGGVLIGVFSGAVFPFGEFNESSFPVEALTNTFSGWTALAGFIVIAVPSIFVLLLGASVVAKKIVFNAATGWTLFVLFFISVGILSVSVPKLVYGFKETGKYKVEKDYQVRGKKAYLNINQNGLDDYDMVYFNIEGHAMKDFRLVQEFESQGSSRARAIENAKMVEYNVDFKDSVFTFDSNMRFKEDAEFRGQRLKMTLYVPFGYPFVMSEDMSEFLNEYVDPQYQDGQTWTVNEKGLQCLSCPKNNENELVDLNDFDEIEINGKFDLRISPGDEYRVELIGDDKDKDKYDIQRSGRTLIIDYKDRRNNNFNLRDVRLKAVTINVTMPRLDKLEANGFGDIRIEDFDGGKMELEVRGPVKVKGDLKLDELVVNLTGSAVAELDGEARKLEARVEFASRLEAFDLQAEEADVEASAGSVIQVTATQRLDMDKGIAGKIEYRGNPAIVNKR